MSDHINATVSICGKTLSMVVDTGSDATILTEEVYKFLGSPLLRASACVLRGFGGNQIPTLGCFDADVLFKGRRAFTTIQVVPTGICILGKGAMRELSLQITFKKIFDAAVSVVSSEVVGKSVAATVKTPEMPMVKGFSHKILLKEDATPTVQKLRPLPYSVRDEVSAEIQRLLEAGIIERVETSEWVSPIVVARKPVTGEIRLCVDLREVNKRVVPNRYPLPNIEDLFVELSGAKFFSKLDLSSAYLHVPLQYESRKYTTFVTHDGLFRYTRMPFGLCSAPSAFSEMMKRILGDFRNVKNLLDDIICYANSLVKLRLTVRLVLERLRRYNLSINWKKSEFNKTRLPFLGRVVSENGIEVDRRSIAAILDMPAPENKAQLRSFLGLCGWNRSFIKNYASICKPLTDLLSEKCPFVWSESCVESFRTLKEELAGVSSLRIFDYRLPTILECDASDAGIGAVLLQKCDGVEKPITYISRVLSEAEKKYSVGEKEALCVIWAVQKLHKFVWGREFIIRSDHQALTTLLSSKGSDRQSLRIGRWSSKLLTYNYTLEYKKGSLNSQADALSRLPVAAEFVEESLDFCVNLVDVVGSLSLSELAQATDSDQMLSKLRSLLLDNKPLQDDDVKLFGRFRSELSVCDGCVFKGERVIVPLSLRSKVLTLSHEGHQGEARCKQRAREYYYWLNMDRDIENMVKECVPCKVAGRSVLQCKPPLTAVEFPSKPWSKLGMDIVGPMDALPQSQRYAITLIDYYSKWPEVCFTGSITSAACIDFLTSVFSREGFCDEIVTDNGRQFCSSEFRDFLHDRGIKHCRTSTYNPQSNGEIERFHRNLKQQLIIARAAKENVCRSTQNYLFLYRNTAHATTGYSPSQLLHGRLCRSRLSPAGAVTKPIDPRVLADHVAQVQKKFVDRYNLLHSTSPKSFTPGERVFVKVPAPLKKKLDPPYRPGVVGKMIGPSTVLVDGEKINLRRIGYRREKSLRRGKMI